MHDPMFTLPNGSYLLVPSRLIKTLEKYRQFKPTSKEQGGMLLGVMRAEDNELVNIENPPYIELLNATEPCCKDHATRTKFVRRCDHHFTDMQNATVLHSDLVYLGEWHTHPQDNPTPSTIDLNSWRKAFSSKIAIVVIVGRITNWWGIWTGDKVQRIEKAHTV